MHITLESDYAIRIVNCLCKSGVRMDARKISESTGVTLRFALKILRKLVASGIVKSFKGMQGGYELAKKPNEITLKEVIETVEGSYVLSRCLNPGFECTNDHSDGPCRFHAVFAEISRDVAKRLDAVTFECPSSNT
mgnify:FL=1